MAHMLDVRVASRPTTGSMRPNSLIVTRFATRGAQIWVGARLLAGAVIALAGGEPLFLSMLSALLLVAIGIALGLADIHRRHERALLENLGVSRLARVAFFALPAFVGEGAIALLGSVVG